MFCCLFSRNFLAYSRYYAVSLTAMGLRKREFSVCRLGENEGWFFRYRSPWCSDLEENPKKIVVSASIKAIIP